MGTHMDKLFMCLWLEVYLKLHSLQLIGYTGDKKVTLTIAQAIALMQLMQKVPKQKNVYVDTLFRSVIATIDQQTA
jgi:hypothetical protein